MRAIGMTTFGGPDVLRELDHPEPEVGDDEVRIHVAAVTVNNGDLRMRRGEVHQLRHDAPWVPGMEAAGVVDAVGTRAADRFRVGEAVTAHVWPIDPRGGAYAELTVADMNRVVRTPHGASIAQAATLPMNGLTAYQTVEAMGLERPGTVAVIGAAGAVGGYIVQLAVAAGHRVVADAADTDRALVESLGAHVVVPRGDGVVDAIRAAVGEVDAVALAAMPTLDVAEIVRPGGAVASVVGFGDPGQVMAARRRRVRLAPVVVDAIAEPAPMLRHLGELTERGEITLRVADELPAEDASEAHRRLESGGVRGRIVLRF
ncbi:NADP-dependent oxidoreductase [Promicromonospora sp. MEB111]|uniref:NADP-dependent oxidoreductase n=1 Tax=Promicromonospora sp. MEB111 TaxID=3040301 RepID=UPI00254E0946|nr:NADP-dependent oxidoreductase [Promicromonospora sp. MEB111]